MTTAKEALLKAGRIQAITRGRISKENHAWLAANPDKWDSGTGPKPLKVPRAMASVPKPEPVGIVSDIHYTYPEDAFKAIDGDGKERGMREVCNTCRVSLVAHMCQSPTILGGIPVTIVSR